MIFLIDQSRTITGYQSFPDTTDAPHIRIQDPEIAHQLQSCIGFVQLNAEGALPEDFHPRALIQKKQSDLNDVFQRQLMALKSEVNRIADQISREVPEAEKQTWLTQESEARGFLVDAETPTPVMDAICTFRGCDKNWLAHKIIEKADFYRAKASELSGKRQKIEDQLKAAWALKDDFEQPENPLAQVQCALDAVAAIEIKIDFEG